jgi:hypothetical protein
VAQIKRVRKNDATFWIDDTEATPTATTAKAVGDGIPWQVALGVDDGDSGGEGVDGQGNGDGDGDGETAEPPSHDTYNRLLNSLVVDDQHTKAFKESHANFDRYTISLEHAKMNLNIALKKAISDRQDIANAIIMEREKLASKEREDNVIDFASFSGRGSQSQSQQHNLDSSGGIAHSLAAAESYGADFDIIDQILADLV